MKIRIEWSSWIPLLLAAGMGLVAGVLLRSVLDIDWQRLATQLSTLPSVASLTTDIIGLAAGMIGLAVGLGRVRQKLQVPPGLRSDPPAAAPRGPVRVDGPPTRDDHWRNISDPWPPPSRASNSPVPERGERSQTAESPPALAQAPEPPAEPAVAPPAARVVAAPAVPAAGEQPARQPALEPVSAASSIAAEPSGWPERLLGVWERYRKTSEGFFTAAGLQRVLRSEGIEAEVVPSDQLAAEEEILGVAHPGGNGRVYLLPSFTLPARAVEPWFEDHGPGVRTTPLTRLHRVAVAERGPGGISLRQRGVVT